MKKVLSRLCVLIVAAISVAGCLVRFVQLIKYTDKNTGFVVSNYGLSYVIYGLFAVAAVLSILYGASVKKRCIMLNFSESRHLYPLLVLLSISYFYDFLHQCYNLYCYIKDTDYIEYNYAVFIALSAAAALLSCFYIFMISLSVKGFNYDFRRLDLFNFIPAVWAFMRLIIIMMRIVDFKEGTESICEFLFLTVFICFSFSLISAADKNDKSVSVWFAVFGLMSFFSSCAAALPRVLAVLTGKGSLIYIASYSSVTYLFAGLFAGALVFCTAEKTNMKN